MNSISVIIPYYNNADTITGALASVYAQTLPPAEIIVVDDASATPFADTPAAGGIPTHCIRLETNRGPAGARNAGIAAAQGEWIAFLDADDEWLPSKLEQQMALIAEHPDAGLVAASAAAADETIDLRPQTLDLKEIGLKSNYRESGVGSPRFAFRATQGKRESSPSGSMPAQQNAGLPGLKSKVYGLWSNLPLRDFAVENPVITSTVLVRKALIEAVGGFDEQFRGPEDYDLWVRIASAAAASAAANAAADETTDCRPQTADLKENGVQGAEGFSQESGVGRRESSQQVYSLRSAVYSLNTPLIRYRTRSGSLSMDDRTFLPQVLRVLDKVYGEGGALAALKCYERHARAHQYAGASWMAFCRGARARALYLLLRSCAWQPWMATGKRWKLMARYLVGEWGSV